MRGSDFTPCRLLDEGRHFAVYAFDQVTGTPYLIARVANRSVATAIAAELTDDNGLRRASIADAIRTGFARDGDGDGRGEVVTPREQPATEWRPPVTSFAARSRYASHCGRWTWWLNDVTRLWLLHDGRTSYTYLSARLEGVYAHMHSVMNHEAETCLRNAVGQSDGLRVYEEGR